MKRFIVGFIPLSFMVGLPAIAGRMACVLAAALLACASSSHGQVIEEGGFPVKGGNNSGEPFSLSCPPRLVAQAGESVLFSCTATAVPEEGVRYEWEPVSGDGFHLLSDASERSPLFTAPLSEAGAEYVYRLTAMSVGVYETATVTVSVKGVPEETVSAPVVREECNPFTVPEGLGEGCAEDKGPVPFGFGPESDGGFLFPEAEGLPDRPSRPVRGGGPGRQAPPRLECPVAVFLEELETGQVECHAWDTSGEEYLDYSWEPVGSTTRDYLDNPRLIPEDSPTPSVVAPETPAYETLESFRSGETTFRYRYRLTATSRATGLSSSSEVEVYVSSSRPGVYCPLEVVVEEGETIALDCEGVDPLSHRMDYDEESASVLWEWEGLWATSTSPLAATDLSSPLFTAPAGSAGKQYHYIASMTTSASGMPRTARRRVTVTVVSAEEAGRALVPASRANAPSITCEDAEIYEATEDFTLDCSATDEPSDAEYAWTARGSTSGTSELSSTTILAPTFYVPDDIPGPTGVYNDHDYKKHYRYRLTMYSANVSVDSADVTVTVLEKPNILCGDSGLLSIGYSVYEGDAPHAIGMCSEDRFLPARIPRNKFTYRWTGNTDVLSATNVRAPTFNTPQNVDGYTRYNLNIKVSAPGENADTYSFNYYIRVYERPDIRVSCEYDNSVYEGLADITFDCSASGAPGSNPQYTYVWTARGDTPDTALLSATDIASPTFDVPEEVDETTTYEYLLTASARRADEGTAEVTVTVLNHGALAVVCADPGSVYEGAPDITFDCEASGAPAGSTYEYVWTPRGDTQDTALLSASDIASPTFDVPEEVDETTTYEYLLTASARRADEGTAEVTVTVLNLLDVACASPRPVYEGSADITFDCEASGAPAGSTYEYVWTPRGDTQDTALLSASDIASPVFYVPDQVAVTTTYEYLLTVSAANSESSSAMVTVTVLNHGALAVVCADPGSVYEGAPDIAFDCEASGAPAGSTYEYVWTPRGDTQDTALLSAADVASPTFAVPDEVNETTTYEYLLTASADNAEDATAEVTVTVLNHGALAVVCADPGSVYEGSSDIAFDCEASGTPSGSGYTYAWTPRGDTPDTALLSATDISSPVFYVPGAVDATTTYEYRLTVSAANAESSSARVTVTVLNRRALVVVCADPPSVYEGSANFDLDCSASGAPAGSTYEYVWTHRRDTPDTALLSAADISSPVFYVPGAVDATTTYEYLLTASAENAEDGTAEVTVTVLNRGALAVVCADPGSVYEGSSDIAFDCEASGAPAGSTYEYVWTHRRDTPDTALLSAADISSPVFYVPGAVDATTTYEYLLTASAENAEDGTAEVTVTVLNRGALAVVCRGPRFGVRRVFGYRVRL